MMSPPSIIFICYVNRSGSTYLANLFSKSPEICVCPEADILVDLLLVEPSKICSQKTIKKLQTALTTNIKLKSWNLNIADIILLFKYHTNVECFILILNLYLNSLESPAKTLLFKAERLIQLYKIFAPDLNKKYNIKWISIIRDCRAVYYSQMRTIFPDSNKYMSINPIKTTLYWKTSVRKSLTYSNSSDFYIIYYEKLISDPVIQFSRLIESMKFKTFDILSYPGSLNQKIPLSHRSIHQNIDKPPLKELISRWENFLSDKEIFSIQLLSNKLLIQCGYQLKILQCPNTFLFFKTPFLAMLYLLKVYLKKLIYRLLILIN